MSRGGKRPGAGRKRTKDTPAGKLNSALVQKVLADGTTPLQVMLEAMKTVYEKGGAVAAVPYAKECAPYVHPKLAATEHSGSIETQTAEMTDSELGVRIAFALALADRPPSSTTETAHDSRAPRTQGASKLEKTIDRAQSDADALAEALAQQGSSFTTQ